MIVEKKILLELPSTISHIHMRVAHCMEDYCRPTRKTPMFLTLRSAEGFRDQYSAQTTAMSNIRKFVLRSLGDSEPSDIMEIPDELYLRRRVFTRVSLVPCKHGEF